MTLSGPDRMQGLVKLVRLYTDFGPGWAALAEEHWAARRREEALQAARRALMVQPGLHDGFSLELKMASRPILNEVTPKAPISTASDPVPPPLSQPVASTRRVAPRHDPAAIARAQMLKSALSLADVDERVAMLRDLEELAPTDPEILFHLAKELAVAGRMDEAREAGENLNRHAPERYVELYDWAEANLASARAQAAAYRARHPRPEPVAAVSAPAPRAPTPAPRAPTPAPRAPTPEPVQRPSQPPSGLLGAKTRDRTLEQIRERSESQSARERAFDEAATLDVALTDSPLADADGEDEEEVTARASVSDLGPPIGADDQEEETARLHLVELERLVAVSVDPKLDS